MTLHYREGVSILEIVFYAFIAPLAIFLATRHGFGKSSGWYFLILFALFRFVGGILQLVSTQSSDATTAKNAFIGAIVCNSIGLSPLNLMLLGMLSRVNDFTNPPLPSKLFKWISIISLVALILSANGGTQSSYTTDANGQVNSQASSLSKAAIIIFLVVFIVQLLLTAFFGLRLRSVESGEKRLILTVALCSPFMVVRYAYALAYTFSGQPQWSPLFGDVTRFLILGVLMEIAITALCTVTGLTLRKRAVAHVDVEGEELSELNGQSRQNGQEDRHGRRQQTRKRKAKGPISWLFFAIKDLVTERKAEKGRGYSNRQVAKGEAELGVRR